MANRWGNSGNSKRLYFGGVPKSLKMVTEIRRCLLLGRKAMTNLDSILKSRDIERIRKLWYIYTIEYHSAIKKNTFESVLTRWM